MSNAQHTPSPWHVVRKGQVTIWHDDGKVEHFVCSLLQNYGGEGDGDRLEADANLISAAPDLLEVCQLFQHYAKGNQHPEDEDTWAWFCRALVEKLNAAVAKAEGRSND
jgi:hypothetical protein